MAGEVVFSTGMVGYPESLTDPSYQGQILTFTFPLIGNYGMPVFDKVDDYFINYESGSGKILGLIVADYSGAYSHWNSESGLAQWLYNQQIPAISGIDTRTLTKKLREKGAMLGKILISDEDIAFWDPNETNLVAKVSISEPILYKNGEKRIALIDCGCKYSILRNLLDRELEILRVPWDYPFGEETFDGVLISSGPGDPKMCKSTINNTRKLIQKGIPTFGICLGHQIISLAIGADTEKMKYGHRSQNQPVIHTQTNRCYITTQNHGFMVKAESLPQDWSNLFMNLNDQTSEGLIHQSGKFFSTQFHPEAAPGPVDTMFLFDQFVEMIK